jgi:NitT/TauT family transport system substrate-binding protein
MRGNRGDDEMTYARTVAASLTLVASLAAAQMAWADDALKVVVGGQRAIGENFVVELGNNAGLFKKHGLALDVLYVNGSADTQQAIISGSAQVGTGVGFVGALGMFAKGAPIRIIGANMTGGSQLYWYVRSDSPIKTVQDAAGKTVAYSGFGSSTHAAVLAVQKHFKVAFKPTATGSTPATFTAVMSGQIDVGWAGAPFGLEQLAKGETRVVWKASAAPELDKQTIRVTIANAEDFKRRPDVYTRFMRGYRDSLDWIYSTPEGLKAYAALAKMSEPAAKRALDEFMPRTAVDADRISGINEAVADAVSLKYMPAPLTKQQLDELIQIPERRK